MSEQRKYSRIPFRQALGVEAGKFEEFQGLTGFDLSAGGVRMRSEQFLAIGTQVRIRFKLENEEFIVLRGKVVWTQKEPEGEYYQMGIEFYQEPNNDFRRRRVQDYIEDRFRN